MKEGNKMFKKVKIFIDSLDDDQSYFNTPEWKKGEQEASEDIKKDRVKVFNKVEDLLEDLE